MTSPTPEEKLKLLPCPFCGGEARFDDPYTIKGRVMHVVMCSTDDCPSHGVEYNDSREAVAARWNHRSPSRKAVEVPVAWQYQLPDGRWSNMPGDWTPDEEALGQYTYRPLYAEPPTSRKAVLEEAATAIEGTGWATAEQAFVAQETAALVRALAEEN